VRQNLYHRTRGRRRRAIFAAALAVAALITPARALDHLDFTVSGDDKAIDRAVRGASLLLQQKTDGSAEVEDLFTAARSDYANILGALYSAGHYSAVIHILIDGREASSIAPLDAPARIGRIAVSVDPGPRFAFSRTEIAPLLDDTELPKEFRPGETAATGAIEDAVAVARLDWRNAGYAKVAPDRTDIVANHATRTVSADIRLDPGPELRFGPVSVQGAERMRIKNIIRIAGLRDGERFSQTELDRAAMRLRRSGVFSSVTLSEGEVIRNGGLLPIEITVAEQKPRRYSVGAELSSVDGLSLTASWLHRNVNGGGERLKIEGSITNIGANGNGMDYGFGMTFERPATFSRDITASLGFNIGHTEEADYTSDSADVGLSLIYYYSDQVTFRAGIGYEFSRVKDPTGDMTFSNFILPLGATWDRRDSTTDARKGFYLDATAKPFLGLGSSGSGIRVTFDARGYKTFGEKRGVTFALRLQGGAIEGSSLLTTPRDDLFFSGGGGTVRGQPYHSLGIPVSYNGGSYLIGGTHFLGASAEMRARVTDSIGIVAFYDWGRIDANGFFGDQGADQAGAGIGLRYETGFGPIRLDVATPVSGSTGDGVQLYIGLGQAF
jgi:translocation and assembly module TamA